MEGYLYLEWGVKDQGVIFIYTKHSSILMTSNWIPLDKLAEHDLDIASSLLESILIT